jgi:hypothetical protein
MNGFELTQAISMVMYFAEPVLALIALLLLAKQRALGRYKSLTAILIFLLLESVVGLLISHLYPANRHLANEIYFYEFWSGWLVEAILMPIFCYGILTRLFSSLPELRSISTRVLAGIVFLWCAASASPFLMPHGSAMHLMVAEVTQLKRLEGGVSLLTAMVVFACMRPLGLRFRSPLPAFGLGLIFSAMIVFSTGFGRTDPHLYIWIAIFGSAAVCAQLLSWVAAIVWSEPTRQIVSV